EINARRHCARLSVVIAREAGHPVCNARAMRQMRAISRILWLLDLPPARGTFGGGAALVGRLQAGDVELHHLKHRLRHQARPRLVCVAVSSREGSPSRYGLDPSASGRAAVTGGELFADVT